MTQTKTKLVITMYQAALVVVLLALSIHILWWPTPWIGVPTTILFFLLTARMIGASIFANLPGRFLIAGIAVASLLILSIFFFILFFTFQPIHVVIILWVAAIFAAFAQRKTIQSSPPATETTRTSSRWLLVLGFGSILLSITAAVFYFLDIYHLQQITFYHGLIPDDHSIGIFWLFVAFIALGCAILSPVRRLFILPVAVIVLLAASSTYVISSSQLYGADNWRHYSIEKHIASHTVYEPTTISGLLSFQSEKFPNGTQYATIPLFHTLTGLPVLIVHKYLAWLLLGPLSLLIVYYGARSLGAKQTSASLAILFAMTIPAFLYIGGGTFPQAFGLFFFLANAWLWLTRDFFSSWPERVVVILLSTIAAVTYPVTALFSVVLITGRLVQRGNYFSWLKSTLPVLSIVTILVLASILPMLDILLKKIPLDQHYLETPAAIVQHYLSQFVSLFQDYVLGINPLLAVGFLIGVGILWTQPHLRKIAWLVVIILPSLQITQWFNALVANQHLAVFSDRVYLLMSLIGGCLFVFGAVYLAGRKKILAMSLIVILSGFAITQINPNSINFGYSISAKELKAIDKIADLSGQGNYVVLADEVTSAAGNAITGFDKGHYYWYPGSDISNHYWDIIEHPDSSKLRFMCEKYQAKNIYLLYSPIPPSTTYQQNIHTIASQMKQVFDDGEVRAWAYTCNSK